MRRRPLPQFKNQRALVRFLDDPNTDLSLYDLETFGDPVGIEIDKEALELQELFEYGRSRKLRPVTMRLNLELIQTLKYIATHKGISYQTLARMWLRESALRELRRVTAMMSSHEGVRESSRSSDYRVLHSRPRSKRG